MPEQILPAYEIAERYPWPGMRLIRAFRIAVDLRKLLLAAVALILVQAGDRLFGFLPFAPESPVASKSVLGSGDTPYDLRQGGAVDPRLAAEVLNVPGWTPATLWRLATQWEIVLQPIRTMAEPVVALVTPGITWPLAAWNITRLLWMLSVWAIFGGAILRMGAVQFARDVKIRMWTALRFSTSRYLSSLSAPLLPMTGVGLLCLLCGLGGLLGRLPAAGPVIVACGWFLALAFGFLMTLILLGLAVGWPLMWAAISTEGSDAFDGFSRSYSYAYSRPWHYLVYAVTAIVYGSVVTIFLTAVFGMIVHVAAWSVGIGMGSHSVAEMHSVAPMLMSGPGPYTVEKSEPTLATNIVGGWLAALSLLLSAFTWSYFWTASLILYFLLRNSDDATRFDEVWLPEEEEKDDLLPLVGVAASEQPVVERPIRRPDERTGEAEVRENSPAAP